LSFDRPGHPGDDGKKTLLGFQIFDRLVLGTSPVSPDNFDFYGSRDLGESRAEKLGRTRGSVDVAGMEFSPPRLPRSDDLTKRCVILAALRSVSSYPHSLVLIERLATRMFITCNFTQVSG
jgi:hypothetical protein